MGHCLTLMVEVAAAVRALDSEGAVWLAVEPPLVVWVDLDLGRVAVLRRARSEVPLPVLLGGVLLGSERSRKEPPVRLDAHDHEEPPWRFGDGGCRRDGWLKYFRKV